MGGIVECVHIRVCDQIVCYIAILFAICTYVLAYMSCRVGAFVGSVGCGLWVPYSEVHGTLLLVMSSHALYRLVNDRAAPSLRLVSALLQSHIRDYWRATVRSTTTPVLKRPCGL